MGVLVAMWTSAPTCYCSCSGGCTDRRLILTAGLLLLLATTLSSGICVGLAGLSCFWSRWRMLGMTLCSPGTFVRHVEELGDVMHVMRGQLLEHLLVPHTLLKSNNNKGIRDARDGVPNLGEPLDGAR
jgi:hypothetical protein